MFKSTSRIGHFFLIKTAIKVAVLLCISNSGCNSSPSSDDTPTPLPEQESLRGLRNPTPSRPHDNTFADAHTIASPTPNAISGGPDQGTNRTEALRTRGAAIDQMIALREGGLVAHSQDGFLRFLAPNGQVLRSIQIGSLAASSSLGAPALAQLDQGDILAVTVDPSSRTESPFHLSVFDPRGNRRRQVTAVSQWFIQKYSRILLVRTAPESGRKVLQFTSPDGTLIHTQPITSVASVCENRLGILAVAEGGANPEWVETRDPYGRTIGQVRLPLAGEWVHSIHPAGQQHFAIFSGVNTPAHHDYLTVISQNGTIQSRTRLLHETKQIIRLADGGLWFNYLLHPGNSRLDPAHPQTLANGTGFQGMVLGAIPQTQSLAVFHVSSSEDAGIRSTFNIYNTNGELIRSVALSSLIGGQSSYASYIRSKITRSGAIALGSRADQIFLISPTGEMLSDHWSITGASPEEYISANPVEMGDGSIAFATSHGAIEIFRGSQGSMAIIQLPAAATDRIGNDP